MTTYALANSESLDSHESVIADALRSFVDIGHALSAIRDGGLYHDAGFKTFEAYCRARWDFKKSRAYQLIAAAEVVGNVHNCGQGKLSPPSNESHARELAKLDPEEQAAAWEEAVARAPPAGVTARHVAEVVAKRLGPVAAKPVKKEETQPEEAPPPNRTPPPEIGVMERLAKQREEKPDFIKLHETQRQMLRVLPSNAQRMLIFLLEGGEIAMARLGVDWDVTHESLKKSYRNACFSAHPDRGGSTEEFSAITRSHDLIKNYLTSRESTP